MCSSENVLSGDGDDTVRLRVKNIGNMTRNCSCEITTKSAFLVCLSYSCPQCRPNNCARDSCLCAGVYLTVSNTCNAYWPSTSGCSQVFYSTYPCQLSTTFTLTVSMKPWTSCMKNSGNLTF